MGLPHFPAPSCLVIGLLLRDPEQLVLVRSQLASQYGPTCLELEPFPFMWTSYYQDELGPKPWRAFLAFEQLVERTQIPEIKLWTNDLEAQWSDSQGRMLNIDPGFVTLGQLFLATTKDQRQRVYMRDGIYVEPTLYFQAGQFHSFEWTYRDYQSQEYRSFYEKVRKFLAIKLKAKD